MKKKTMLLPFAAVAAALMITACGQKAASSETSAANASETETKAGSESSASAKNSAAAKTAYPLSLTIYDAEGKEVEMSYTHAPEHVLSTQLSMTELLIKLGLKDKIVAVFDNDNALEGDIATEIASLKSLGDKKSVSKESILALEPDLILGKGPLMFTDTAIGTVQSYQELGIPVYTELASASIDQSLKNIPEDVRNIGKIFDVQDKADAYADELDQRIDTLLAKVGNQKGELKKVLFHGGLHGRHLCGIQLEDEQLHAEDPKRRKCT